jgi:aryl-alcohol dehydrogenase-like predicted oxidoreductase
LWNMKRNKLGKTEIEVSRTGFGVLAVGRTHRNLSVEEGSDLLLYGLERGINFFDTAQYYEEYPVVKEFLKKAFDAGYSRDEIVICTKSLAEDFDDMRDAVDEAIAELGTGYVDIFLMHEVRSGQLGKRAGAWQALQEAKASGKVRAIGISTHHTDVAEQAAGLPGCDCVFALLNIEGLGIRTGEAEGPGARLPGYGISDREGTREEMEEALEKCHEAGLGVFTMKALGGGNLAADYRKALGYVYGRSFVDSVMLGMSSGHEVDDIMDLSEGNLAADYVPDVSDKVLKVNHDDCVGCGECMKACASGAIYYGDDGLSVIDHDRCIDCGYCAYACPVRAIIRV